MKEESAANGDEEDDTWYSIRSESVEDSLQQMVPGEVPGLWTSVVDMPAEKMFIFNILQQDDDKKVLCPQDDRSRRMTAPIIGPAADAQNVWVIEGKQGAIITINLFAHAGRHTVSWSMKER